MQERLRARAAVQEVLDNKEKYINARLLKILSSTQVPDPTVVDAYLTEIAKAYGVEYIPKPPSAVQPMSATLGIALPTPGMPMPGQVPEPLDVSDFQPAAGAAGSSGAPPPMTGLPPMATEVPMATPVEAPPPPQAIVPVPYSASLTKSSVTGVGLVLDTDNVVVSVKPGEDHPVDQLFDSVSASRISTLFDATTGATEESCCTAPSQSRASLMPPSRRRLAEGEPVPLAGKQVA